MSLVSRGGLLRRAFARGREVDFSDQHQADGQSYTQGDNLHYIVLPSLKKGANCDPDVFHIVIVLFSGKIKSNTVP